MGCDAAVALGRASIDGQTLFGQNRSRPSQNAPHLCRTRGRAHAIGESVLLQHLELPQARNTYTVLASHPDGHWGYDHGLNEHQLAIGSLPLRSVLRGERPGLIGTDLVRLGLEQCQTARQAVTLLTHLIESCGQGSFPGCNPDRDYDSAFVIADPSEAYVIETAGGHWVYQETQEVRASGGVRVIRQDWDRISRGLADLAIKRGWWPQDGSKIDFAGVVGEMTQEEKAALKRWTGASFRLQEQNGHIDLAFIRRLLTEQDESEIEHQDSDFSDWNSSTDDTTTASMVAGLSSKPGHAPMAWCALGSPCPGLYFPVFLDGELPELLSRSETLCAQTCASRTVSAAAGSQRGLWASARDSLLRLQARIDLETEEFLLEYAVIKEKGYAADLERQTSLFMEHNVEQVEEVLGESIRSPSGMSSVP